MDLVCTKCKVEKPVSEFHKTRRRTSGYQVHCKQCRKAHSEKTSDALKAYRKEYYAQNKERIKQKTNAWKKKNPEAAKKFSKRQREKNPSYFRSYRTKNAEHMKTYFKNYWEENREQLREQKRQHYKNNKNKILAKMREDYPNRKPKIREWSRAYVKRKRHTDPKFKLKCLLRRRLSHALLGKGKWGSAIKDLGCSVAHLKDYLEGKFYKNPATCEPMTWDNHGNGRNSWQIDHVKDLRFFDLEDPEQFKAACHFTNLQPLWHEDHVKKTWQNSCLHLGGVDSSHLPPSQHGSRR